MSRDPDSHRSLHELAGCLNWQIEMGADEAIADAPQGWPRALEAPPERPAPAAATPVLALAEPSSIQPKARTLEELRLELLAFEGCGLKRTAKNLVFADGNPSSPVMMVGEAPGEDEDRQGLPFVGVSGKLLDRMAGFAGLTRENFYITNILPWRPPGNRSPSDQEIAACMPFIERHVALVRPRVLIALGGVAAKTLLKSKDGITKMRGKRLEYAYHDVESGAARTCLCIPMFHPAYLLRQSSLKRLAWRDWLMLKKILAEG